MCSYIRRTYQSSLFSCRKLLFPFLDQSPKMNEILVWWQIYCLWFVGLYDSCLGCWTRYLSSSINGTLIINEWHAITRKYSCFGQCRFHSENMEYWIGQMSAYISWWEENTNDFICNRVEFFRLGRQKHASAVTWVQVVLNYVVSSGDDGTVKLWDLETGDFIRDLVTLESATNGGK